MPKRRSRDKMSGDRVPRQRKSEEQVADEIGRLPKAARDLPKQPTNLICSHCTRPIESGVTYFIMIESGEPPTVFCESCVNLM